VAATVDEKNRLEEQPAHRIHRRTHAGRRRDDVDRAEQQARSELQAR